MIVARYALRYTKQVIQGFADRRTAAVFANRRPKSVPSDVLAAARRKLVLLDVVESLDELKSPPGNRLEALKGDRAGQHSIKINKQWRVCFVWKHDGPHDVEIVDDH